MSFISLKISIQIYANKNEKNIKIKNGFKEPLGYSPLVLVNELAEAEKLKDFIYKKKITHMTGKH